jgi:hypothetical protein
LFVIKGLPPSGTAYDSGMLGTSQPRELEIYETDQLVDELVRRYDRFVFGGEKFRDTKRSNYEFYWKGSLMDRLRLCETTKTVMLKKEIENAD